MPVYLAPLIGNGVVLKTPTADGTNGQAIVTDGAGTLSFATISATPAGSDAQLQYNNAGAFGASSLLTFDGDTLAVGGANTAAPVLQVTMPAGHSDNAVEVLDSSSGQIMGISPSGFTYKYASTDSNPLLSAGSVFMRLRANNSSASPKMQLEYGNGSSTKQWYIAGGDGNQYIATGNANGAGQGWIFIGAHTAPPTNPNAATGALLSLDTVNSAIYFGARTDTTPANASLNGEGGKGTNIAGATVTIASGKATGNAAGGSLLFQTSQAGASGTTLQSLSTVLQIDPDDKIGVFGATPVVQPSGTGETTGFTAGSGTSANDDSTYTGNTGTKAYTVSDIVKALKNLGIMAAS